MKKLKKLFIVSVLWATTKLLSLCEKIVRRLDSEIHNTVAKDLKVSRKVESIDEVEFQPHDTLIFGVTIECMASLGENPAKGDRMREIMKGSLQKKLDALTIAAHTTDAWKLVSTVKHPALDRTVHIIALDIPEVSSSADSFVPEA